MDSLAVSLSSGLGWAAIGLASGAMLFWAALAALPIVLHLLYQRRRRRVAWPAMQFLQRALQKRARSTRIWQWILLALRVLAILLIAIALADPYQQEDESTQPVQPRGFLLAIDASYSMEAIGPSGRSRFDAALEDAGQQVREAPPGTWVQVVVLGGQAKALIAEPTRDRQAAAAAIARLRPTAMGIDWRSGRAVLERAVEAAGERPIEVHLWSDAQRRAWEPVASDPVAGWWASLAAKVERVAFHDVAAADPLTQVNRGIASLQKAQARQGTMVLRSSDGLQESTAVQVRQGDREPRTVFVDWSGQPQVSETFTLRSSEQPVVVEARLPDDALELDNVRWMVTRPPTERHALLVGRREATRYLAVALTAGETNWQVTRRTEAELEADLIEEPRWDAIMFCDVANVDATWCQAIEEAAGRRVGVAWWLGPRTTPQSLAPCALPLQLLEVAAEDVHPVDPRGYTHPISSAFEPFPDAGLLSMPIFRYWRVAFAGDNASSQVLGVGAGSDPLLVGWQRGGQRRAVFTTLPAVASEEGSEAAWNALVAWPSLVPLVQEMAAWLAAPRGVEPELQVGDWLSGVAATADRIPDRVVSPKGEALEVQVSQRTPPVEWSVGTVELPGVYTLQMPSGTQMRVANVAVEEGDLTPLNPEAIERLERAAGDRSRAADASEEVDRAGQGGAGEEPSRGGGDWFRWLLAAAGLALVGESLMSRFALRWQA